MEQAASACAMLLWQAGACQPEPGSAPARPCAPLLLQQDPALRPTAKELYRLLSSSQEASCGTAPPAPDRAPATPSPTELCAAAAVAPCVPPNILDPSLRSSTYMGSRIEASTLTACLVDAARVEFSRGEDGRPDMLGVGSYGAVSSCSASL